MVIQLPCRCEIRTERLLDHDADPVVRVFARLHHAMCTESRDDVGKILGRHRQVEQPVATRAELFIQICKVVLEPFEAIRVIKIRLEELKAIKEGPNPRIELPTPPS